MAKKKSVTASSSPKRAMSKALRVKEAYQKVFTGVDGELVLEDLMKVHHMLGSTFSKNTDEMLLREGERNAVLRILSILKIDISALRERIESNVQETIESSVV